MTRAGTSHGESPRNRLRALPVFPPELPEFDTSAAPANPMELFRLWLDAAVDADVPAAHAMTLSTIGVDGAPSARVLLLKEVDADGWQFATERESPKGQALAHDPRAALSFFWPQLGRQVRIIGTVVQLSEDAAARDFLARPEGSRASTLIGRQSEPLAKRGDYGEAFASALEKVRHDSQLVASGWAVYSLHPTEIEFWQASHDRGHLRLRYSAREGSWTKELLWP